MKICTRVRLKPSNDRGEFELDRARSKYNIAENSIALEHETHNKILKKCFCLYSRNDIVYQTEIRFVLRREIKLKARH